MIMKLKSYVFSEIKRGIIGSFSKKIEDVIHEKVIIAITVMNPDPTINEIAIPCDTCPYLRHNGTCRYKCHSWYPLLAERLVYNSLPEQDKLRAQVKHLKKKCEDLGV